MLLQRDQPRAPNSRQATRESFREAASGRTYPGKGQIELCRPLCAECRRAKPPCRPLPGAMNWFRPIEIRRLRLWPTESPLGANPPRHGWEGMPGTMEVFANATSECHPDQELNSPGGFAQRDERGESGIGRGRAEHRESKAVGTGHVARRIQIGMVQGVEEIGAQRNASGFAEPFQSEAARGGQVQRD